MLSGATSAPCSTTPPCAEAARRVQAELAAMPGPERGVELLERLATERRPLTRAGAERP